MTNTHALLVLLAVVACSRPSPPAARTQAASAAVEQESGERGPTSGPPVARVAPVEETFFGIKVVDRYRWMEAPDNPEFERWVTAQGEHAGRWLSEIPARDALHARIREIGHGTTSVEQVTPAGDGFVYLRTDAGAQRAKLVFRTAGGSERVLVDPEGAAIASFSVSHGGDLVAYNIAERRDEIATIRIMEVASGKLRGDRIERVWGWWPAAWLPDGDSLLYSQISAAAFEDASVDKSQNMTLRFHRLGTPVEKDVPVLARGLHESIEIAPAETPFAYIPPGSRWVIGGVAETGPNYRSYIAPVGDMAGGKVRWRAIAGYEDSIEDVVVLGDDLFLLTTRGASNRRVLRVPAARPIVARAAEVVPEDPDAAIVSIWAAKGAVYVVDRVAGRARLRRLDVVRRALSEVRLPAAGWIERVAVDPRRPGITVGIVDWMRPAQYWSWSAKTARFESTGLASTSSANMNDYMVESREAQAADGERVPITILRRKDLALDGSHPAVIEGYGGYGYSTDPHFWPWVTPLLDRGVVFAFAHVRGGGEKGHRWYLAGKGLNKPTGVRDFHSCAEALVQAGYARKGKLAATGGSMGGVLIGRAFTERPDLYAAVGIRVGEVNSLRIEHMQNGPNHFTEQGDPRTEEGFRALRYMDVVHNVADGVRYPAVILSVGLQDSRTSPWQSGKLAARLQAATSSDKPILLRVDRDAGHGYSGAPREQVFAQFADIWAFFLEQTGDPDFHVRR